MNLIHEIEISYFRSFYKFKISNCNDLNIIFGKNDSGKSNLIRALNLFFSGYPDHNQEFEFPIDFCDFRSREADQSDDVRKFLYVKLTFNTPPSYQKSLGKRFYVKRQWTVSRGRDYNEEYSANIPKNKRHIVTRFLNKIKFIYIQAIKDVTIFEMLLAEIHSTVAGAPPFAQAVDAFAGQIQNLTENMFANLPTEVSPSTKIGAPTRLGQMFQTLDFETLSEGEQAPKSLTRQRGDGIKVRHIPELLKFISDNDNFDYHIWGFEEPENSLDFVASQSEAMRMLAISKSDDIQVFITSHSPSFYLLKDQSIEKIFVRKKQGLSIALQGRELKNIDARESMSEGFYLPAVAEALAEVAIIQARAQEAEAAAGQLRMELAAIARPVVLTEGRTDAAIISEAWRKLRGTEPPFDIRSCDIGGENAGAGNGGAQRLAIRLKGVAHDHPHRVIGIFDYDPEGIDAYRLDRNFREIQMLERTIKQSIHGQSYALLLPAPEFRQDCAEYQNLPIEFLFADEILNRPEAETFLSLKRKFASTMVGARKIQIELADETHFKEVRVGKVEFATVFVPTLDPEYFSGFAPLLNMLEGIINS